MRKAAFVLALLVVFAVAVHHEGSETATNSGWSLRVDGLVGDPYTVTYGELLSLPAVNVSAVLYCVDNPSQPLKNGTWTGVPLSYLIERAKPLRNATKIVFLAGDGYTTDLWLSDVMNDTSIILAYRFNGKNITPRLVVPGRWGYKWIKDVVEIRLVDYNYLGTWERVGYSDSALINESRGRRAMS